MSDIMTPENWIQKDRDWNDYPIDTMARSINGGHWTKVERGWKWCLGSTFPTPGGDASGMVCLPKIKVT